MGKMKELIAEDDLIIAMDAKSILEKRGFEIVYISSTGENAIKGVKEYKPDIVLMDSNLPGEIDSVNAAGEITSRYGIPLIFLTAHSDEEILKREKITETYGYILKPINENELYATIVTSLNKREQLFHSIVEASSSQAQKAELQSAPDEHTEIERELLMSEKKFKSLFNLAPDAIYLEALDGTIVDCNEAACKMTGYSRKELLQMNARDLVPAAIAETFPDIIHEGLTTGRYFTEALNIKKSGEHFPIEVNINIIEINQEKFVLVVTHDITNRKIAEEALRESERAFRELAELLPQTVFECDLAGKFTYANRYGYESFGYTKEDFERGVNILDMLIPEEREKAIENVQRLYRNAGHIGNEYTAMRKDGSTFPVKIYSTPIIQNDKSVGLRGIAVDMTDIKLGELALRESEERYRVIAENAFDVIWTMDTNLHFTYISPSVQKLCDYTAEEVMSRSLDEIFTPESYNVIKKTFAEEMAREQTDGQVDSDRSILLELDHLCRDGSISPVEIKISALRDQNKKLIGILGVTRNITDRKRAEEKYQTLIENINIAICVIQDMKVKYINPKSIDITGYSIEELKSRDFVEFIHPDDREVMFQRHMQRLSGEKIAEDFHFRIIDKSGNTRWMEYGAMAIDWEGKPGLLSFMTDITERKLAEEKIKLSLYEKDMLLKEIHHRVKNNMQVISSLLNIQSRHVSDERDKELFKESQNRVRSMALIHEKLYQSGDLSRINFAKYLTSITKELFHSYQISPELIELTADVTETHLGIDIAIPCALIINELVSNSLKYAFPDGKPGHIQISFNQDKKGTYTLTVSDNGIGFPKDINFQNTESLGLQLVNTLTKQLNGKIELDRKKGTRFTISF
jgi:PAS domain S-box-containing protein